MAFRSFVSCRCHDKYYFSSLPLHLSGSVGNLGRGITCERLPPIFLFFLFVESLFSFSCILPFPNSLLSFCSYLVPWLNFKFCLLYRCLRLFMFENFSYVHHVWPCDSLNLCLLKKNEIWCMTPDMASAVRRQLDTGLNVGRVAAAVALSMATTRQRM